jgi:hypothetical protein
LQQTIDRIEVQTVVSGGGPCKKRYRLAGLDIYGARSTNLSKTLLHLFNFIGDGTFSNNGPFPNWLYWDEFAFDLSGSQEKESRVFVDLLSKMVGVKIVPPRLW